MVAFEAKYSPNEYFTQFSTRYVNHAVWANNPALNDTVIDIITDKAPGCIIDLGTGNGQLLSLLPQIRCRIGIDVSSQMLAMINDAGIHRIRCDAHKIALVNSSVDFVVCRQVLHYCEPHAVLSEAGRILRSGGYVLVVHMTDPEIDSTPWYVEWKALKQIKGRKLLTASEIIRHANNANLELERRRCCHVDMSLSWDQLYEKYLAFSNQQRRAISSFFRSAPKPIAMAIRLTCDSEGVSYRRTFTCLLLKKFPQCFQRT